MISATTALDEKKNMNVPDRYMDSWMQWLVRFSIPQGTKMQPTSLYDRAEHIAGTTIVVLLMSTLHLC